MGLLQNVGIFSHWTRNSTYLPSLLKMCRNIRRSEEDEVTP